jgi:hypothetical protein
MFDIVAAMRPSTELDHSRRTRATRELYAARGELHGRLSPDHPSVPPWLCRRILDADDQHGKDAGLVVQGEQVSWSALDALAELALYGMLAHRRLAHSGELDPDCLRCARSTDWQASLLERTLEHGAASAAQVRDSVSAELAELLPGTPVDVRYPPLAPAAQRPPEQPERYRHRSA